MDLNHSFRKRSGFSLLELLVVIAIIGILAGVGLPALKGLGNARKMDSAAQQLVDHMALARARAINGGTTVHLVFLPTNMVTINVVGASAFAISMRDQLLEGPYRTYGFFVERTVGDQPGRPQPYYMDGWKTLPDGLMVAGYEFEPVPYANWLSANQTNRPMAQVSIPFPTLDGASNLVSHLAFGPEGGLLDDDGKQVFGAEFIELSKGSILATRNDAGALIDFNVREIRSTLESAIRIRVDGFTGKAKVVTPEIQ